MANREPFVGVGDLLLQMKITNRLLAAQLRHTMSQQELISLLLEVGATAKEIALVVGTSEGTVKNAIVRLRKRGSDRRDQSQPV